MRPGQIYTIYCWFQICRWTITFLWGWIASLKMQMSDSSLSLRPLLSSTLDLRSLIYSFSMLASQAGQWGLSWAGPCSRAPWKSHIHQGRSDVTSLRRTGSYGKSSTKRSGPLGQTGFGICDTMRCWEFEFRMGRVYSRMLKLHLAMT